MNTTIRRHEPETASQQHPETRTHPILKHSDTPIPKELLFAMDQPSRQTS